MDIEEVDPALREATQKLPVPDPSRAWMRTVLRLATRMMRVPQVAKVTVRAQRSGALRMRVYQPRHRTGDAALLWIHGGGLLFGDARQDEALCAETSLDLGIPVVSANYRFAPEHPFPAALDDVHAVWGWMHEHAEELGIDAARIVIGGQSAGGGLAASLAQRLHDEGGVQPLAQWLFAPMIDDRTAADESLDGTDHWVWNNRANRVGWTAYLGTDPGADTIAPYAAAARREDLSGLPPTFIAVGDIELFRTEDEIYAMRLERAGVPVVLDLVPGAPHGFESWARGSGPARALMGRAHEWLRRTLLEASPTG
ncbi:esterase [Brachybacterium avium]|uniref:Esterase n=1 Tax=Brachybacterium avium TaxID=2017485 RepID=A0A220U9K2_9MICO|nr:alpha/beta hydrolase [Brachybacterium avium]ASK64561.1 esterase [Brachybacterium avium]